MEELKEHWRLGHYTPVGYLVEIFAILAAPGEPIAIPNVKEFCQTWEIGERQFYRAKAKLVERGDLEEECGGIAINLLD